MLRPLWPGLCLMIGLNVHWPDLVGLVLNILITNPLHNLEPLIDFNIGPMAKFYTREECLIYSPNIRNKLNMLLMNCVKVIEVGLSSFKNVTLSLEENITISLSS